jgi:hypothetical protein
VDSFPNKARIYGKWWKAKDHIHYFQKLKSPWFVAITYKLYYKALQDATLISGNSVRELGEMAPRMVVNWPGQSNIHIIMCSYGLLRNNNNKNKKV